MTHVARLADAEWQQRLAAARHMVAAHRWSPEEADARLMPWLALALHAGAEPPEAARMLEDIRRHEPDGKTHARAIAALRLCDPNDMRAELARSRDAAVSSAMEHPTDPRRAEQATRLQYLAIWCGCPPRVIANDQLQEAA
ncbi:hypothetical protein ACWPMX_07945 [Tsuneonella sp. HG094]